MRMIVIQIGLFLRIQRAVDELAGGVKRLRLLLFVKEVGKGCKAAVDARLSFHCRLIACNGNIGLALVIEEIEHRVLNIDLTVDERLADHVERIVIRPAVGLHHGITGRDEIGDHVALGDLRRADHVAVFRIGTAFKIRAVRNVDFRDDLRIVLADIGGNVTAREERAAQCRGKRNCRYFRRLLHCILRNWLCRCGTITPAFLQFLSIIAYFNDFRNDFAMKIMQKFVQTLKNLS